MKMLRIELHTTCRIMLCFVMTKRQLSAESCLMHPCEEMMVFSLMIESFPELTYSPTLHLYSSISNKIGLMAHI